MDRITYIRVMSIVIFLALITISFACGVIWIKIAIKIWMSP
jgi:hypothetical protein